MSETNPDSNVQILAEENHSRDYLINNQKMSSPTSPVKKSEVEQCETSPLENSTTTDEVIDADPISYSFPMDGTAVASGSLTDKEQSQTSPMPRMTNEIIVANPISCIPHDDGIPAAIGCQPDKEQSQTSPMEKIPSMTKAIIVANPISCIPHDDGILVANGSPTEKEQSQASPLEKIPSMTKAIIVADPISCVPDDDGTPVAIGTQTDKSGSLIGQSASKPRKVKSQKTPPEWLEKYNILCKERSSGGRVDKFYHHKERKEIKFRSLKEVERYEKHGILPGHRGKTQDSEKAKSSTKTDIKEMLASEEKKEVTISTKKNKEVPTEQMLPKRKEVQTEEVLAIEKAKEAERRRIVEHFLREARYNLEHTFDGARGASSSIS